MGLKKTKETTLERTEARMLRRAMGISLRERKEEGRTTGVASVRKEQGSGS